ncbi:hypothetical protein CVT25_003786 [Psilocybe cyanescens]|uniref:Uncharacterized protein n=1 Tax=Psilocybe cyanescens TaxID=93625 RepID=A0A409WX49_PSICY|nr:hypothetical protein CVT25_003786 [Psilocybe cyanescens]
MIVELKLQQHISGVPDIVGRMQHIHHSNEAKFDNIAEDNLNVQSGPTVQQNANDNPEFIHGQHTPTIMHVHAKGGLYMPSGGNCRLASLEGFVHFVEVAWAISSDEDLASDGADPNSVTSIEAVHHVLSHENLNILASVGATDAVAVWSNSSDSGADNSLGPVAKQQYSTILPNPITPPVGPAKLTAVWYSSDEDQSSYSASAPPSDRCLSQADSSTHAAQVHMAVDSVTPSPEEASGDFNNEQQAADADDTEEFVL